MATVTNFQSRLDIFHSRIARKLIDNKLRLHGSPVDVLVIKKTTNKEGDSLSHIVKDHLIVPCVWPDMKDVPYRSLKSADGSFAITSLVNEFDESEAKNYIVSIPHKYHIETGNLLFRVFLDDDYKYPVVLVLEAAETLGDFTLNMLVQSKINCVLSTESFPQEISNLVGEFATARMKVGY
jgi:hypothetical protein